MLVHDIAANVVSHLSVFDLDQYALTSRNARRLARTEVGIRVRNLMSRYIPHKQVDAVIQTMKHTDAVFFGPTACHVAVPSCPLRPSIGLHLAVPGPRIQEWVLFLEENDWTVHESNGANSGNLVGYSNTMSTVRLKHPQVPRSLYVHYYSRHTPIPAILSTAFTSQMVFVDGHAIYIFHPELLKQGMSLARHPAIPLEFVEREKKTGLKVDMDCRKLGAEAFEMCCGRERPFCLEPGVDPSVLWRFWYSESSNVQSAITSTFLLFGYRWKFGACNEIVPEQYESDSE